MKINNFRVKEPAGQPPEGAIKVGRSKVESIVGKDGGITVAYKDGRLFFVPWANVTDAEIAQTVSESSSKGSSKSAWLKRAV